MSKVSNETYVRIDTLSKDGKKDFEKLDEEKVQERIAEIQGEGGVAEVKYSQTFGIHEVGDEDPLGDLQSLVTNPVEMANIINRSLRIKQTKAITDLFKQDNFTPVEGIYDLADVAAAVSERKSASPEQKAATQLSKLLGRQVSVEELANILAAMGTAASA